MAKYGREQNNLSCIVSAHLSFWSEDAKDTQRPALNFALLEFCPHTKSAERETLRMAAVSSISAMKVETPRSWQSPAPTRAKMQSRTATSAASQGTKLPTCAISTATPTCMNLKD